MITITVDKSQLDRFAAGASSLAARFPRECAAAVGLCVMTVRSKMRAVMRKGGGSSGVPAFAPRAPLSAALNPGGRQGGVLAKPHTIQAWKSGGVQHVGWVGTLSAYGEMFQESRTYPFSKSQLHFFHRRLGARYDSAMTQCYSRPARPVIDPLADNVRRELPRWFASILAKKIDAKLKKGGF